MNNANFRIDLSSDDDNEKEEDEELNEDDEEEESLKMDSLPLGQIGEDLEIIDQEGGIIDLEDQDETLFEAM